MKYWREVRIPDEDLTNKGIYGQLNEGRFKWGVQISRWWNPLATEEPLKSHIRKTAKIFCLATIPVSLKTAPEGNHLERFRPVSLKTAPEGNHLERFRETATIIKRKVTVRTRELIARGSILYKNSDKEYLQQQIVMNKEKINDIHRSTTEKESENWKTTVEKLKTGIK
ncbi:hypothetical protein Glove_264g57 [Diversispora epigaea]|uniref:Uncharacterized protein n=1 Tax=Diversispora epigaea TaxID=1348612 RepID=A0A397I9L9_9GLOM|nr:hypothetical protein Glove_264g57 [Diversispora epigaea]